MEEAKVSVTDLSEDVGFLDAYAGAGLEDMPASATSSGYLGIVQPDSSAVDDDNQPGTWRNSLNKHNFGNIVRVVPLAFKTIWSERESEPPFRTVNRYEPNSIEVEMRQMKNKRSNYPKMYNKETGNEVQELYIYAVLLADHPEEGVLYFSPTAGSMRACRQWNGMLQTQVLPNGMKAPIFGYSWNLLVELIDNPAQPGRKVARFTHVDRDAIIGKDLFTSSIKPQLEDTSRNILRVTATTEAPSEDEE